MTKRSLLHSYCSSSFRFWPLVLIDRWKISMSALGNCIVCAEEAPIGREKTISKTLLTQSSSLYYGPFRMPTPTWIKGREKGSIEYLPLLFKNFSITIRESYLKNLDEMNKHWQQQLLYFNTMTIHWKNTNFHRWAEVARKRNVIDNFLVTV
jgi:hypothetical protein